MHSARERHSRVPVKRPPPFIMRLSRRLGKRELQRFWRLGLLRWPLRRRDFDVVHDFNCTMMLENRSIKLWSNMGELVPLM